MSLTFIEKCEVSLLTPLSTQCIFISFYILICSGQTEDILTSLEVVFRVSMDKCKHILREVTQDKTSTKKKKTADIFAAHLIDRWLFVKIIHISLSTRW